MRGKVTCRFIGGPQGDETLTLSAMACRDVVTLADEVYFQQGENGGMNLVKGDAHRDPKWISYSRAVYEKHKPITPGAVIYRFVRNENVERCEKTLGEKGRRCKNEALPGDHNCRAHKTAP